MESRVARVRWTRHLERYFPALGAQGAAMALEGDSARAIVQALESRFAGIAAYIVDERGSLRPHVNIFVDGRPVRDRDGLSDVVGAGSEVVIMQALSGG